MAHRKYNRYIVSFEKKNVVLIRLKIRIEINAGYILPRTLSSHF